MPSEAAKKNQLRTAQIGRCGELLVQYELLRLGIDSAPMTTDSGVDLVAYASRHRQPLSIQVKTNERPKPGGGKGKLALDWWVSVDTPAQLVALVDLATRRVWMLLAPELAALAQQTSGGRHHIYMYTDAAAKPRVAGRLVHVREFERFLLENRADQLFSRL